jgi:hypothetical protein
MNTQIKRAVALALAAGIASGAAHATEGPLLTAAVSAGNVVYASGSTAVAAALTNYFDQVLDTTNNPCSITAAGANSQLEFYSDSSSGSSFVAYACTSASSGQAIAFVKENNAGSGNGLGPVGADTVLTYPLLTGTNNFATACTASNHAAVTATVNGTSTTVGGAYTSYACSGENTTTLAPNLGFADVDPALFGKSPAGFGITTGPTIDLVFAPAVSLGLYHALQVAENITPDNGTNLASIPNMTKGELTSIFTGQTTDWSFLTGSAGTTVGATAVAFGDSSPTLGSFEGTTATPSSTAIHICRRDDFSGTEKTMETYFGGLANNGGSCLSGVNPWVASTNSELLGSGWANGDTTSTVFANSSTGNVLKCLEANDSVGQFAIGYASVDNPWGTNGTPAQSSLEADFRYIKVDGILPSIENAASGRYPIFAQSVYAIPSNTSQANSLKKSGANAQALALQTAITGVHGIGYFKVVEAVNALDQWSTPSFHGGLLAIPSGVSGSFGPNTPVDPTASNATFFTSPVNLYYKTTGGVDTTTTPSNIDNCQTPVVATINEPNNTPVGGVTAFTPTGN